MFFAQIVRNIHLILSMFDKLLNLCYNIKTYNSDVNIYQHNIYDDQGNLLKEIN